MSRPFVKFININNCTIGKLCIPHNFLSIQRGAELPFTNALLTRYYVILTAY